MPVEDPGQLQVTCDDCGDECEMETTQYAGSPPTFGVSEETIESHGWLVTSSDTTYCPKCRADNE